MARIETVTISFNGETREIPIKVFPTHAYTVDPVFVASVENERCAVKGRLQRNYEKTHWVLDLSHGATEGALEDWYYPELEQAVSV